MSKNKAGIKSLLKDIAQSTLASIELGRYSTTEGRTIDLRKGLREMKHGTAFFGEDSELSDWRVMRVGGPADEEATTVEIGVVECSTLTGARRLSAEFKLASCGGRRIGVLSFGSAKNPGGGFINGAQAQVCVSGPQSPILTD